MEKLTKKNVFEALVNFANGGALEFEGAEGPVAVANEDLKAFALREIELLDNKAKKAKETAAKKRAAGDELTEVIFGILTDEPQTIADVTGQIEGEDVTPAKVQYRLNALFKEGKAQKVDVKIEGAEGTKARVVKAYLLA